MTALVLPARASTVVRAMSFGGGVQSHAVLVLQAQHRVSYDVFLFCNVGADSENPDTLAYIENCTKPYCEDHGIRFVEIAKTWADGHQETLWQYMHRTERSVPIPARMGGNGAPGNRACTEQFKIEVVDRWLVKEAGATDAVIGLGISTDEFYRARDMQWHRDNGLQKRRDYPLIDQRLSRQDCKTIIAEAGLPLPPKSSCFFCPFRKRGEWIELKRQRPDLFARAVALEKMLNKKRGTLGRDAVYLHPSLTPLDQAVGNQLLLFDMDEMESCDAGVCMV